MTPPKTQILLATYNGERFLEEQLTSILSQTHTDWEIIARDDGSTDRTPDILAAFEEKHPDKIKIIKDTDGNLGYGHNFSRLMEHSTADIICFADQDDIWHEDKIERGIECLEDMQEEYGHETPLLVHHDFSTISSNGDEISGSYNLVSNMGKENGSLNHILIQNVVHGFSAIANRALIDKASPLPKSETSHDHHIALVASTFGHIEYMDEPMAKYRIHDQNVLGNNETLYDKFRNNMSVKNVFNGKSLAAVKTAFSTAHEKLDDKCTTAKSFLNQYGDDIPEKSRKALEDFARLSDANPLERKALIVKNGFLPTSPKLAAAFIVLG